MRQATTSKKVGYIIYTTAFLNYTSTVNWNSAIYLIDKRETLCSGGTKEAKSKQSVLSEIRLGAIELVQVQYKTTCLQV